MMSIVPLIIDSCVSRTQEMTWISKASLVPSSAFLFGFLVHFEGLFLGYRIKTDFFKMSRKQNKLLKGIWKNVS